ncbi:MAG: hypothetical protein HC875_30645 [Anaerolineales bacterium]|nr:hypothetical protein [Anaerolineales bacterium]
MFFDATTGTWPVHPNDIWALSRELTSSSEYGVLDAADGYLLLKRGLTATDIPTAFYDFARVADPQPQYSVKVEFGDELRLIGYDVLDDRAGKKHQSGCTGKPSARLSVSCASTPSLSTSKGRWSKTPSSGPC